MKGDITTSIIIGVKGQPTAGGEEVNRRWGEGDNPKRAAGGAKITVTTLGFV